MAQIPQTWKCILDVLIAAPIAWQTPREIAAALACEVETTSDLLCEMDLEGWIAVWDGENEPRITLTPLAAERLGVSIVEFGAQLSPRWARAGDPVPAETRPTHIHSLEQHARPDQMLDPYDSPDLAAENSERLERRAASLRKRPARLSHIDDLPCPIHLLGSGLTPWPGPAELQTRSCCPACGDRPLAPHVYCLCCNRWGLDDLLAILRAKQPEHRSARETAKTSLPDPVETGKAAHVGLRHQIDRDRLLRKSQKKTRRRAKTAEWQR
jgi:hypothetical protein